MIGILYILSSIFQLAFVAISVIGLPGNIISLIFPIIWWINDKLSGFQFFIILTLIITGEVLEQFAGVVTGKKTGMNNKSLFFSFAGAIFLSIFMAPLFFGLGAIIGAFAGAFAGTYFYEIITTNNKEIAFTRGIAALKGRFLGTILKFTLGISASIYTTISLFKNF